MKRLYWLLLALLSVMLVCVPAIAEETECTEHVVYPGIYDYWDCDETMHWTTCEVCGEVQEHYEHWVSCGGNYDQCEVCKRTTSGDGIVINVYHNWEWQHTETHCWMQCPSCGECTEVMEHIRRCTTEDECAGCGLTASGDGIALNGETYHDAPQDKESWVVDAQRHYTHCMGCGEVIGEGDHGQWCTGDSNVCMSCKHTASEDGIVIGIGHNSVLRFDENLHWWECADCGVLLDYGGHEQFCTDLDRCGHCQARASEDGIAFNGNIVHWAGEWGNPEYWEFDENQHWSICYECGEAVYHGEHKADCTDPDRCRECGHTASEDGIVMAWIDHVDVNWDERSWDEHTHFHECRSCGGRQDEGAHWGNCGTDTCLDCGAEGVNLGWTEHVWSWTGEGDMHWQQCACGEQHNHGEHGRSCLNEDQCAHCGLTASGDGIIFHYDGVDHIAEWGNPDYWSYDETHHWTECRVCGETVFNEEHVNMCDDGDRCHQCGHYASEHGIVMGRVDHVDVNWDERKWDEYVHYLECRHCGGRVDEAGHWGDCGSDVCGDEGCGATGVEFEWANHVMAWYTDGETHWESCACGEQQWNHGEHERSCVNDDQCRHCGLTVSEHGVIFTNDNIGHNFDWRNKEAWRVDETRHWAICTDCGEEIEMGEHIVHCTGLDGTGVYDICQDCGYSVSDGIIIVNTGHNPDWETWEGDENVHYYICYDCGGRVDEDGHSGVCGTGHCDSCGADGVNLTYKAHVSEWKGDENGHWEECVCGEQWNHGEHFKWCANEDHCITCHMTVSEDGIVFAAEEPEHAVDWGNPEYWQFDEFNHWAACWDCGETVYEGEHHVNCDNEDWGRCQNCGHNWEEDIQINVYHGEINWDEWESDEYSCWRPCDRCDGGEDHHPHTNTCENDNLCIYCGAEDVNYGWTEHVGTWKFDANMHWEECVCGEQQWNHGEHQHWCMNEDQCRYCGATASEHGIVFPYDHVEHNVEWRNLDFWWVDGPYHWAKCADCGQDVYHGEHNVDCNGLDGTGNFDICQECGHSVNEHGIEMVHINHGEINWDAFEWNEDSCWRPCDRCDHGVDVWPHVGTCENPTTCIRCGAENIITAWNEHVSTWKFDADMHWEECACGEQWNHGEHQHSCVNEDQCAHCGFTASGDGIIFHYDHVDHQVEWGNPDFWGYDENYHWTECRACGETVYHEEHVHSCDNGDRCHQCGHYASEHGIVMGRVDHVDVNWDERKWDEYVHYLECRHCGGRVDEAGHWGDCGSDVCGDEGCGATGVEFEWVNHVMAWYTDGETHWESCACGEQQWNHGEHERSCVNDDQCRHCGLTVSEHGVIFTNDNIGHNFDWRNKEAWRVDETRHWAICTDCGEEIEMGEHIVHCTGLDGTGVYDICQDCGYSVSDGITIVNTGHNWDGVWYSDENSHYYLCSDCEGRVDEESHHNFCGENVCMRCGAEGVNFEWSEHITEWHWDETRHWEECPCGEVWNEFEHEAWCLNGDECGHCHATASGDGIIFNDIVCHHGVDWMNPEAWEADEFNHWTYCHDCGNIAVTDIHNNECYEDQDYCPTCGLRASEDGIQIHVNHDINEEEFHHDENSHWFECRGCDYRDVVEDHIGACTDATICTICGAEDVNTANQVHIFGQVYDFDENGHFQPCIYCGEQFNYYPHEALCGNPDVCGVCGASVTEDGIVISTDSVVHTWGEYEFDADKHWAYCTTCGEQGDNHEHFNYCYMDYDYCLVCLRTTYEDGINLTIEHEIKYDEPQFDENVHWYECLNCGYREGEDVHVGTCQDDTICKICGAEGVVTGWSDHVMDGKLYFDSDSHWWVCKLCGEESSHFTHLIQCDTNTCRQCGQTNVNGYTEHVDEAKEWQSTETHCWYICNGCGAQAEYGNHYLNCQTGACIACGRTDVTGDYLHEYDFTAYEHDDTSHWVVCLLCGEEAAHELHGAACNGESNVCGYCGQSDVTISGVVHTSIIYGLRYDTVNHWYDCYFCAEPTNVEEHVLNAEGNCVCGFSSTLYIAAHPADVTVPAGTKARTSVAAEGAGLTYQWYVRDIGGAFVKSSTTSATYVVEMTAARDGREVYCVVTDQYGNSVVTNTATLTMGGTAAAITSQPGSVTVAEGEKATVTFTAEGDGLTYAWYFKDATASKFSLTKSFTGNTYTVDMNASRDGRQLYCVVTDQYGNSVTTDTVTISMEVPKTELKITSQPGSVTVAEGEKATVTFTAEGDGLTYAWYFKDATASKFSLTKSFTGNTYTVEMNASRDGRQLYCVVTDQYGNTVQTNTVTISMEIPKTELKITSQPGSVTVAEGEKATVTFTAEGDGLTYAWYFKDATASKFSLTKSFTGNSYTVEMNASRDGRQLYCVVTDQYGNSVTTDTVTISMEIPKTELKITSQPGSVTVAEGEKATVTFTAEGDGLTYAWYFKDATASKFSLTKSFTGNSYTVEMNASRDGRQLYCVVTDQYGNTVQTNTVTISMEIPKTELKITSQPGSVTVAEGEKAVVTFTAQGDGLTYAWYYKDAAGSKFYKTSAFTSNVYSIEMTAARDGRQLYCVVTDAYGNTVTTNTVTISMEIPNTELKITSQPCDVTVAEGKNAVVSFTAEGEGLTYEWYFKNAGASSFTKTATFTGTTYTVKMDASRDGRQVYCKVTDVDGNSVNTEVATLYMTK